MRNDSSAAEKRGHEYGVRHLTSGRSESLLEAVSEYTPPTRATELIELGSIYVNGTRVRDCTFRVREGDQLRFHLEPRRFEIPEHLDTRVIVETPEFLIVDKPAGIALHALVDNAAENLLSLLEIARKQKLFITHRLDVETSGLVLIALTREAQVTLNEGFANRTIKRRYLAITDQPVALGTHVHFMEPSPKAPKTLSTEPKKDWIRCEMQVVASHRISPSQTNGNYLLQTSRSKSWYSRTTLPDEVYELEIELKTGRPQQIRSQLAALGSPIIGDTNYGSAYMLSEDESTLRHTKAVALCAASIRIGQKEYRL